MAHSDSFAFIGLQLPSIAFNLLQFTSIYFNLYNTFRLSVGKETPPEVRHQSINQLCIYACTCTCVIAHAPQAFGIVERAWVCAYAVRVAGVVLLSRPFASSRFEPAASNPQKLSCAKRSALHWHISKSQGSSRGIAR